MCKASKLVAATPPRSRSCFQLLYISPLHPLSPRSLALPSPHLTGLKISSVERCSTAPTSIVSLTPPAGRLCTSPNISVIPWLDGSRLLPAGLPMMDRTAAMPTSPGRSVFFVWPLGSQALTVLSSANRYLRVRSAPRCTRT